ALQKSVREITGCAAGTVRHADKVWHIRFEVPNGLIESLDRLSSFRWKELERKRGGIAAHDVGNVHRLGAYLRSCRDFRSTQPNHIFGDVSVGNRLAAACSFAPIPPDSDCSGLHGSKRSTRNIGITPTL